MRVVAAQLQDVITAAAIDAIRLGESAAEIEAVVAAASLGRIVAAIAQPETVIVRRAFQSVVTVSTSKLGHDSLLLVRETMRRQSMRTVDGD